MILSGSNLILQPVGGQTGFSEFYHQLVGKMSFPCLPTNRVIK